jgi:hypothetical protein
MRTDCLGFIAVAKTGQPLGLRTAVRVFEALTGRHSGSEPKGRSLTGEGVRKVAGKEDCMRSATGPLARKVLHLVCDMITVISSFHKVKQSCHPLLRPCYRSQIEFHSRLVQT